MGMRVARCLPTLWLVMSLGCGGAFQDAIDRGDARAGQGRWDEAAAAYARALQIDPEDQDAAQRLEWARRHQATARTSAASERLRRGDPLGALALLSEATALDPHNPDAARLTQYAAGLALDEAEQKAARGARRAALEDVRRVLSAVPTSVRATTVDDRLRDEIALLAYESAAAFAARGLAGNAAVELAGALDVRPEYRDAAARLGEARLVFRRRATFFAVVASLGAEQGLEAFASRITPERIAEKLPPEVPLRVVAVLPSDAPKHGVGLRLGGFVDGYRFRREDSVEHLTCEYVCERWLVDNPAYARVGAALRRAESQLSSADAELSRREAELDRRRADLDRASKPLDAVERKIEKARSKLDGCRRRAKSPPDKEPCETQVTRVAELETERRKLESARKAPARRVVSAKADQASSSSRRGVADAHARQQRERLADTPRKLERQRHCDYDYDVAHHRVDATLALHFAAEALHEDRPVFDEIVTPLRAGDRDVSRSAHPGRCAKIADADPLELASEGAIRTALVEAAVAALRQRVLDAYEVERARVGASAELAAADGDLEQAVELWMRFAITSRSPVATDGRAVQSVAAIRTVPAYVVHRALGIER